MIERFIKPRKLYISGENSAPISATSQMRETLEAIFKHDMSSIEKFIDSRNQNLYFEVLQKTKINLIKHHKWASRTTDDLAEIYYTESDDFLACFTHELLHIKYHHLGLKYPIHTANSTFDESIIFLFNQLSHHRFYDEFIELGFEPSAFLNLDLDKQAMIQLEQKICELENNYKNFGQFDLFDLLTSYISLKSPHENGQNNINSIKRLKAIGEKSFFSSIDKILEEWKEKNTFDASLTLAKIFRLCNYLSIGFCISKENKIIYAQDI